MDAPVFLDTNILVLHVVGNDPVQSPKATAYFRRIEQGEIEAHLIDTVIIETIYVLQRSFRVPRAEIRDAINGILKFPGIRLANKQLVRDALDLFVQTPALSWADSLHAVTAQRLGLAGIVSFDKGFDRAPGLNPIEPT